MRIERQPITEPNIEIPILEPDTPIKAEFAFRPKTREWWLNVGGGKCQYEYYDEKRGWQECHKIAKHVHHIRPEGVTLHEGDDPEKNVGLPLCAEHHVRHTGTQEHLWDFSFHPDIGHAYRGYRFWKEQETRFGKGAGGPSPFQEAVEGHREKTRNGERHWASTNEVDQYYIQKMRDMATSYIARTGDKKPNMKSHPNYDRSKKWYNKI